MEDNQFQVHVDENAIREAIRKVFSDAMQKFREIAKEEVQRAMREARGQR